MFSLLKHPAHHGRLHAKTDRRGQRISIAAYIALLACLGGFAVKHQLSDARIIIEQDMDMTYNISAPSPADGGQTGRALLQTDVFSLGPPTFFGSGCPADTVRVVLSADEQSVAILFSDFRSETSDRRTRVRRSCNVAVPFTIKQGISIGVFRVDYRGAVYVPNQDGSSALFNAEYFFSGITGPKAEVEFPPGTDDELTITNEILVTAIAWSPCGSESEIFRANAAVTAKKKNRGDEDVQIAIDSADVKADGGIRLNPFIACKYYFRTKECY
eukprot:gene758-1231_t